MDYEQITQLRDEIDALDDVLREKQRELRELTASATSGGALSVEQSSKRDALAAEIQQFEVQKKEMSDLLTRGLAGF